VDNICAKLSPSFEDKYVHRHDIIKNDLLWTMFEDKTKVYMNMGCRGRKCHYMDNICVKLTFNFWIWGQKMFGQKMRQYLHKIVQMHSADPIIYLKDKP